MIALVGWACLAWMGFSRSTSLASRPGPDGGQGETLSLDSGLLNFPSEDRTEPRPVYLPTNMVEITPGTVHQGINEMMDKYTGRSYTLPRYAGGWLTSWGAPLSSIAFWTHRLGFRPTVPGVFVPPPQVELLTELASA